MTKIGVYTSDGGSWRVLFTARQSTPGDPGEGRMVVVYIDLLYGRTHVCDEETFNDRVYSYSNMDMSDKDADDLWDGLVETFGQSK